MTENEQNFVMNVKVFSCILFKGDYFKVCQYFNNMYQELQHTPHVVVRSAYLNSKCFSLLSVFVNACVLSGEDNMSNSHYTWFYKYVLIQ